MSLFGDVFTALNRIIQFEERLQTQATALATLTREVRDIDKRLIRVEAFIEMGMRGGSGSNAPPAIEDRS